MFKGMKKIFSILAAAVIALSFASCEGGNSSSVEQNGFKISVDSITATTAHLNVKPADAKIYYGIAIYATEDVAKYTADSLIDYQIAEWQMYASYFQLTLDDFVSYNWLFQGPFDSPLSKLPSNTDITVIAYEVKEAADELIAGKYATLNFKTKEVKATANKDVTVNGEFYDAIAQEGWYEFWGFNADSTLYFDISPDPVKSFNEAITIDNIDKTYSNVYVITDFYSEDGYEVYGVSAINLKPSFDEAKRVLSVTGTILAENGIEYNLTFTGTEYVDEEDDFYYAPKKTVVKKAAPKALKLPKAAKVSFQKVNK